jgi:hypothetical protein
MKNSFLYFLSKYLNTHLPLTVGASIRVRGGQPFLRGFYGNPTLRAMHSIHKCVAKGAPHLLAVLRNEPRYS